MTTAVSTGAATTAAPWLPFAEHEPDRGSLRLYCLPHAGGSASAYRSWFGRVPGVSVRPVQPPGRETRLRETPHTTMAALVAELADGLLSVENGPYAVYGHSLGALVGFELLREIRRRGGPEPAHLFVSGSAAPGDDPVDDGPPVAAMTDAEVVALLRRIGGTPEWMLTDPTVLRMILPPFRADFTVKESYACPPEPPLTVPVTALAATDDPRAGAADVAGWRDQTLGRFRVHTLTGGHFAVLEQPEVTHRHITEALRATAR
ncbi:thioesterase [Streptomyces sp. ICBB 8177]|uniref:thioesterase II family protein n=1 Tax=Streptomyces sp. ICBB 8177 TaxID=563922 RepID=UPI0018EE97D4|nr:thioesterase [Streptomyces sp. ICBB 8177]